MSIQAHCNVLQKSLSALQTSSRRSGHRRFGREAIDAVDTLFTAGRPCPQYLKVPFCSSWATPERVVMLRRHAHGMPVSRSQSDLQGPQVGAKLRDRDLLMQIFICLRFHFELPFVQGRCQAPRLSRLSGILRRYEGARLMRSNSRHHAARY
jgi:hypothetical protein